jgi:cobalt/nickel transport system permease protein
MHIPDGFLSPPVWVALDALSVPAVGYLARRAESNLDEARIPLLGVMGAFVFAAQMINFPVGVGTSGHLIGSALLAYTLGPAPAVIVMTAILAVQALVFQDGGVLALGANVFNMAFAGLLAAWLPYRYLGHGRFRKASLFLGGALSVLVAASLAIVELRISGVVMPMPVIAVSFGLFSISAILEGAITVSVVSAIGDLNQRWVRKPAGAPVLTGIATVAVLLAAVGVFFASTLPDGLDSLARTLGITHAKTAIAAPLAGYEFPGLDDAWQRKAAAGLAGLAVVTGLCLGVGRLVSRRNREKADCAISS